MQLQSALAYQDRTH